MQIEINTFDEKFFSARRASLLFALLACSVAAFCVLATMLPHDRYVRFQQLRNSDLFRSRWIYERIHYDKTPIDVAIVGTSRVETAVSAVVLEKELTAKFGRPIHVANLAMPDEGRNLHYLVVKELLATHPETRIILVSVSEQADATHPAFRNLADAGDLLNAPLFINHYFFLDAAILPYRQMSYFIQTRFPEWFGVSRSFRQDYMGTDFDPTYSFTLPSGKVVDRYLAAPPEKLEAGSKKLTSTLGGTWHQPSAWHRVNNPEEPVYTTRLVEFAKEHCVEVIFVHLPYYRIPPHIFDDSFYRSLGPFLDARELSNDPSHYADTEHFNRGGTELVSKWLWREIGAYLAPLDGPACAKKSSS